ncbi:MAG: NYN domain-containing protein [Candidatus Peribacteria bacterium]|nr:NYN domain-containing protein [Candidatus Peribacteria bacterium]
MHIVGVQTILGKFQKINRSFSKRRTKTVSIIWKNIIKLFPYQVQQYFLPYSLCYKTYEEKRTDVNIATRILMDGVNNLYDKAIIITGDSDITPAIEAIKKRDASKYFVCVSPKQ